MNPREYTISCIPFVQKNQIACPICKKPGKITGRNIILYRKNITPISKCGIKLRYCSNCGIVYLNTKLLADALLLISSNFHNNYLKDNHESMLHPLLFSVKLENLNRARTQMSSTYFEPDDFAEYCNLFYRQVELLKNQKNKDSFPILEKIDTFSFVAQKSIIHMGGSCAYPGCSNAALKGLMFCWEHYQDENYRSK